MLFAVNRNRFLLLAAAVAAAAIVVVVLIAVGSGSNSSTTASPTTTSSASAPIDTFAGVPQHGDTLGDPKAPTTLTVFEDPQCPFCRSWNLGTVPTVIKDYIRTGRLKLVYRGVPIIGPESQKGLRAIYAAGKQNKLWNLTEALYRVQGAENSGWITDAVIRKAAKAAGADPDAVLAAASSVSVTAALRQASEEAASLRVPGTPTFYLQKPPGLPQQVQVTGLDPATFESELSQALK
jgi:protein-disulfide isomerase